MQAVNEFERSAILALTAEGPVFDEPLEYVLVQVPPMPVIEGPSTIPKNTVGMGPAPQAVMFPPSQPPHFY